MTSGSTTTLPSATFSSVQCDRHVLNRTGDFDDWAVVYVFCVDHGVELVIRTDFGTYDYAWWNIGPENGYTFLSQISTDYAMGKFRPLITKRHKDWPHFVYFRNKIWPRIRALFKEINDKSQPS